MQDLDEYGKGRYSSLSLSSWVCIAAQIAFFAVLHLFSSSAFAHLFQWWNTSTKLLLTFFFALCTSVVPEKTSQDASAEDPSISSGAPFNLDNPEKYCKLCLVSFNNPLMAHQHYVGKKHKRNEARKKLMEEIGPEALPAEAKASGKWAAWSYLFCIVSAELGSDTCAVNSFRVVVASVCMLDLFLADTKQACGDSLTCSLVL